MINVINDCCISQLGMNSNWKECWSIPSNQHSSYNLTPPIPRSWSLANYSIMYDRLNSRFSHKIVARALCFSWFTRWWCASSIGNLYTTNLGELFHSKKAMTRIIEEDGIIMRIHGKNHIWKRQILRWLTWSLLCNHSRANFLHLWVFFDRFWKNHERFS